jgi:tetratricopeptide (TPR) repeat protein
MPRIFISHSSLDRELVEREIISPLRAHGLETWYSTDNIKSASEWEQQIREGLKACDWFLIVLSPRSVASEWVQREVHWAFLKRKGKIVPVLMETCAPEDLHLGLLPIQLNPYDSDYHQEMAHTLYFQARYAEAEVEYRKASELAPNNAEHHMALAGYLITQKKYPEAEVEYRKVIQLAPNDATYHSALGDTLFNEKKYKEAKDEYKKVLQIDPYNQHAKDALELMKGK